MASRIKAEKKSAERNGHAAQEQPDQWWESGPVLKPGRLGWLIPGRVPSHSITLVEGQKEVGKSTLLAGIAAGVTRGKRLHGRGKIAPGDVLWLPGEEDYGLMTLPKLIAAGADLKRLHRPGKTDGGSMKRIVLPGQLDQLEDAIRRLKLALIVIDPLSSWVDASLDLRNDQQIHTALDPLAELMARYSCTCLASRHWTKDRGADRIDRGMGGVALGGVARSILSIDWPDRDSPRRILRRVSCNLGPAPASLEYLIENVKGAPAVRSIKELPRDEDDPDMETEEAGERDAMGDAELLLRRLLDGGYVTFAAVEREAAAAGISPRTLRRAKARLKVHSKRIGRSQPARWEWGPPRGGWTN